MTSEPKQCTIILGMHRSGTSALAGCLSNMGVNFGKAMMPGNQANQAGYFENQDIVLAHDILLRDLGCRWDMMGNLPEGWENTPAADKAMKTLTGILERQLLNKGPFAIKDPRLCRLMPLWNNVLSSLNIDPSFILMLRHPQDVALSLKERDGFDLLKGHLLWMVHNREALQACRGREHVIITFDQLLADPVHTLDKVRALKPLQKIDSREHSRSILEFIRPELKHHHQNPSAEIKDKLFAHYAWVYDQFRNLQARAFYSRADTKSENPVAILPAADELSDFPVTCLSLAPDKSSAGRTHATGIFNNLMDIIGRYEQSELDLSIQRRRLLLASANVAETIFAQIYFPDPANSEKPYSEQNSRKFLLAPGEWQTLRLDIPNPEALRRQAMRIDPLNTRGMAYISNIRLVDNISGKEHWSAHQDFSRCSVEGDALKLSGEDSLEIICTGNDPRLLLPEIPDLPDSPMSMEIWIKAGRTQKGLAQAWQSKTRELDKAKNDHQSTVEELQKSQTQHQLAVDDLKKLQKEQHNTTQELQKAKSDLKDTTEQLDKAKGDFQSTVEELRQKLNNQEDLTRQYFMELARAEESLGNQYSLEQHNKLLLKGISKIDKDLKALLTSARWNAGNKIIRAVEIMLLRKKQPLAIDHIQKTILEIKQSTSVQNKSFIASGSQASDYLTTDFPSSYSLGHKELTRRINRLQKNFEALKKSQRWKLGNALIRGVEIVSFRPGKPLAMDHLEKIFKEYQEAKDDYSGPDHKSLNKYLRMASKDFKALKNSARWKTGDKILSAVDRMLLRGKKATAMDDAMDIVNGKSQSS